MTKIKCGVTKCEYNADGGCKLGKIRVGTHEAKLSSETKCESYIPGGKSSKNSCGCKNDACDISEVKCTATKCMYNEKNECNAKSVSISPCSTCGCGETECNTFKPE